MILAEPPAGAADSVLRKALPVGTRFLIDRGSPHPWLEMLPSINRLIGALALAERLYPDKAKGAREEALSLQRILFGEAATRSGFGD